MNLFNRCWEVKITYDKKTRIYTHYDASKRGLQMEFKSESSVNGTPSNGDLTIHGLPMQDIAYLSTNYVPGTGALKPSEIEVQAGYDNTLHLVLIGNVMESTPDFDSSNPNVKFKIMSGLAKNQSSLYSQISLATNASFKDICANIAKTNNFVFKYDYKIPNKILRDYSFQGSVYQQIDELRTYYKDIDIFIDKNTLYVKSKKIKGKTLRYVISGDSGMIKSPKPTPMGCEVTTYLMPQLYPGEFINMMSKKVPQLNGTYRIQTIKHSGSSNGNDWKTQLILIRG